MGGGARLHAGDIVALAAMPGPLVEPLPVAGRPPPARSARHQFSVPPTVAALVHERLHDDILSLALPPGAMLSENDLAKGFGVSRTPVREALLRLADEGLVEIVPKSGTRVSLIPCAKLIEAMVIRRALEQVAVTKAAACARSSQLAGLHAAIKRQRAACAADDMQAFHLADEAFHAAIAEAAGYPGIWILVRQVKFHVDRFRRLTLPEAGRLERVIEEHERVAEALERRDAATALLAMDFHLDGLQLSLPEIRARNPDYFTPE